MPTARVSPAEIERWHAIGIIDGKIVASAPVPLTEKEFQAAVIREAKQNGWKVFHVFDSRKSEAGFPDILALRANQQIVAELKIGDNKPTAAQLNWIEAFQAAGVTAFIWKPSDWQEIVRILRRHWPGCGQD